MPSIIQNTISNNRLFASYSVRKLFPLYTGNCLRVRRSLDNVEQDFVFVGSLVGSLVYTAAILAFCGAGSGFITKWYSQNGSTDIENTIASTQPSIVQAGVLNTENGFPAVFFTYEQALYSAAITLPQPIVCCAVLKSDNTIAHQTFLDSYVFGNRVIFSNGSALLTYPYLASQGIIIYSNVVNNGLLNTVCYTANITASSMYRNNILVGSGTIGNYNMNGGLIVGNAYYGNLGIGGPMTEMLIYYDLLSADEKNFNHSNQKSFFKTP